MARTGLFGIILIMCALSISTACTLSSIGTPRINHPVECSEAALTTAVDVSLFSASALALSKTKLKYGPLLVGLMTGIGFSAFIGIQHLTDCE